MNENQERPPQNPASSFSAQGSPTSLLQKVANTLSDPDSALALSVAALIPLIRRGKKLAARHPLITAAVIGAVTVNFLVKQKQQMDRRTLH